MERCVARVKAMKFKKGDIISIKPEMAGIGLRAKKVVLIIEKVDVSHGYGPSYYTKILEHSNYWRIDALGWDEASLIEKEFNKLISASNLWNNLNG